MKVQLVKKVTYELPKSIIGKWGFITGTGRMSNELWTKTYGSRGLFGKIIDVNGQRITVRAYFKHKYDKSRRNHHQTTLKYFKFIES